MLFFLQSHVPVYSNDLLDCTLADGFQLPMLPSKIMCMCLMAVSQA